MGLDIYLYRCSDWDGALKREAEYEEGSSKIWQEVTGDKKYEQCTEAEKETARSRCEALSKSLGLGEYGEDTKREKVGGASTTDPEHMCNLGYLRSSYNEGGFNAVTRNALGIEGFYHIFAHERDDDYHFAPDWAASKIRALDIAERLHGRKYRVMECSQNIFAEPLSGPSDEHEANQIAEHQKASGSSLSSYSTSEGTFFFDEPLKVVAVIPGTTDKLSRSPRPCVYVVYESDIDWYVKAAQIAAEMCDYVLSQSKPDEFRLAWSS